MDDHIIQIGQKALITNEENEMLVIKRGNSDGGKDFWDLPGGRLDWGESLREGLIREVREESGLHIIMVGQPISITSFFPKHKENIHVVRIIYPCTAKGEIELSDEHSEFEWVSFKKGLSLSFLDNDYHEAINRRKKMSDIDEFGEGMLQESLERRKR